MLARGRGAPGRASLSLFQGERRRLSLRERARATWTGEGGGREVALLAYPLILGHLSFTIQVFVDRLFLTWYSPEAVAGAVTGLFAVWSVIGLFIGTGEYLTTFVAQYLGAGRPERIGPAVWQGIYFSIGAGVGDRAPAPARRAGLRPGRPRAATCARTRSTYARILLAGAFPIVLMATLATFFAGRGQTVSSSPSTSLATLLNVGLRLPLDLRPRAASPAWASREPPRQRSSPRSSAASAYLRRDPPRRIRRRYRTLVGLAVRSRAFRPPAAVRAPRRPAVLDRDRRLRDLHGHRRPHRHRAPSRPAGSPST